ncbi:hypothetical protein ILYODFUR_002011 [Ilyodon furcidens]|uniref:Uncharacterized protein n=1 Tax=Ilyodon furcidens TaxID=33524 RepID=A0ABV0UFD8_9TELE
MTPKATCKTRLEFAYPLRRNNDLYFQWHALLSDETKMKNTILRGGNIMSLGFFAKRRTGALLKIGVIARKKHCVEIVKQHFKTSARKLKHGYNGSPKWAIIISPN